MDLVAPRTFLSSGVSALFRDVTNTGLDSIKLVEVDGSLQWEHLAASIEPNLLSSICIVTTSPGTVEDSISFKFLIEILFRAAEEATLLFESAAFSPGPLVPLFRSLYHIDLIEVIKTLNSSIEIIYPLLGVLSSLIERILTDILLVLHPGITIPRVLKEILKCNEIRDHLSEIKIATLQCLVGPPTGINLRNIIWHGFWYPGEGVTTKKTKNIFSLLFATVLSFGLDLSLLSIKNISPSLIDIPKLEESFSIGQIISQNSTEENKILAADLKCLVTYEISGFGITSRYKSIHQCIDLFFSSRSKEGENDFCGIPLPLFLLTLLLPQLEHLLRILFVSIHQLPRALLSAQTSVYYTTIDLFARRSFLPDPKWIAHDKTTNECRENKLGELFGASFFSILGDYLLLPAGPRIRDRISHFEWKPHHIPMEYVDNILSLWFWLCTKLMSRQEKPERKFNANSISNEFLHKLSSHYDHYSSLYHPSSILKKEMKKTVKILFCLDSFVAADLAHMITLRTQMEVKGEEGMKEEEIEYLECHHKASHLLDQKLNPQTVAQLLHTWYMFFVTYYGIPCSLQDVDGAVFPYKIETCSPFDVSILTVLQLIVKQCNLFLDDVKESWNGYKSSILAGTASKRQIQTFHKFTRLLYDYIMMIRLILVRTEDAHRNIGSTSSSVTFVKQKITKKHLQQILCSLEKGRSKFASRQLQEVTKHFADTVLPYLHK